MSPYYGPDESHDEIQLERNFIAGDVIVGTGFGVQLVLYTFCFLYLWKRRKQNRYAVFLMSYITTLLIIETVFVSVQAKTVQMIYIDNRNYPGGPWAFFLATQSDPVNVAFYATLFILAFLSDLLVIWRCWIIWAAVDGKQIAYLATLFPGIVLLASFIMGTLWTLQSSQPGLSFYSSLPLAYGTSYYALSLGVNIMLTLLITVRLLVYRRTLLQSLPEAHARHYLSLVTIIIESAALYSVCAALFLITYAVGNPTNQVWLAVASAAQQISGYLIIYRLAEGSAWQTSTMVPPSNVRSGLRFASTPATNISSFHAAEGLGLKTLDKSYEETPSV
ncbi:hypothetical protein B0H10DRAFT_1991592 [Mycena sp. CBHHK59/15]|nr:hypothetical protein B0H10DRAFT_1991592 [Mycena sp. CBHHK59/15]